ncbi:pyruvate carboxylase subunit B [Helicobacter kayseriensis]|uniref:pyruvate carboxylase subunit B n=1 Tax=Helicobacter kayseriensis TaxID=2905877 RepID=UPI001E625F77|nr:pyruvate carboxylase subunit B [Helicobacter kayseriensis]MCE3046698.1 pyruvate carboxylase subunit B [Helicobacter kayseriensis]MCE3048000.1 pyruvate carboxylase subunit B [Helicobacter kayseriensis]
MKKIRITENSLRDGIQSLLATRVKTQDMLEVAKIFEEIGFHSVEVWGGATYDACLRYLGEDPFERLFAFKEIFKTTPIQMLLRGQNLVGYRHYADDVVREFVRLSSEGGVDIFRIFDALNDAKNLKTSIEAVLKCGKHAQGAICYTTSPVHHRSFFVSYAKELLAMGCQSLAIKDMAGLLKPFEGYELIKAIKEETGAEIALHVHSTTGFAFGTHLKALEAGVDILDLSNSALSGGTSHPSTQAMVATLQGSQWDCGLELEPMERASRILKEVRNHYAQFESSFNQIDTEILSTQIPGGMISNLANQLREQNALDKMAQVAQEIIEVRKDFGYIPLVTPTSQIVGTQAVLNVLQNERYKTLTTESKNLIAGVYGHTPAPIVQELVERVGQIKTELAPEMPKAKEESKDFAQRESDVISYALFGEIARKFFETKDTQIKTEELAQKLGHLFELHSGGERYKIEILEIEHNSVRLKVDGEEKDVAITILDEGLKEEEILNENAIYAPMGGICTKIFVQVDQEIKTGEVLGIIEAMKMENEILSPRDGKIEKICVSQGENVGSKKILFLFKEEGK